MEAYSADVERKMKRFFDWLSEMDELAGLAKADPLDFRLKHLPDGRLKDVL